MRHTIEPEYSWSEMDSDQTAYAKNCVSDCCGKDVYAKYGSPIAYCSECGEQCGCVEEFTCLTCDWRGDESYAQSHTERTGHRTVGSTEEK